MLTLGLGLVAAWLVASGVLLVFSPSPPDRSPQVSATSSDVSVVQARLTSAAAGDLSGRVLGVTSSGVGVVSVTTLAGGDDEAVVAGVCQVAFTPTGDDPGALRASTQVRVLVWPARVGFVCDRQGGPPAPITR